MEYRSMPVPYLTIGLDLGDTTSHLFALLYSGEIRADKRIPTTMEALREHFEEFPAARIVIEAGGQAQWISEFLNELGHEVLVANPSALGNKKQRRKNDRLDAETLARKGRSDPQGAPPDPAPKQRPPARSQRHPCQGLSGQIAHSCDLYGAQPDQNPWQTASPLLQSRLRQESGTSDSREPAAGVESTA